MLRKYISGVLIFLFLLSGVGYAEENSVRYLYVSPTGNDKASGTRENPLKTIYGAITKIRSMPKNGDIHVVFREGRYEFDKSAEFDKNAAGNRSCQIYYEAAEGEKVVFAGSKVLDTSRFQTVTDENVLRRLPQGAAGNVLYTDLKQQGIDKIDPCDFKRSANVVEKEYVSVYLNGKRENPAQWPNGENNFVVFGDVPNRNAFRYFETNPLRWTEADQMYIGGYMSYDYVFERASVEKIDTEESTITLQPTTTFGIRSTCAKRWKAFNLLEELDIPGEWFIDLNTMLLYYYPNAELKSNDLLEISYLKQPFLRFSGTETDFYTTVRGITFTQSRGAVMAGGGNHITMDDCTASYIDADAVSLSGTCNTFQNSRFIYIGGYAFEIMNYNKIFDPGENVSIINNYLTKCGTCLTTTLSAITTSTHNLILENNLFHNQYGGAAALGWETSEAKVRYNEVYNCEREMSDCGTFYSGRNYGDPGNEFAYNLIYDYKSKSKHLTDAAVMGIYMDDIYSGAYIHHNILVDGGYGGIQIGGGQNNRVENNIVLNMGAAPMYTDNRGETWSSFDSATFAAQAASAMKKGNFAKKYPWLVDGIKYTLQPIHNTFVNNITDAPLNINSRMKELGTVKGNVTLTDLNDFVDAENYDFRMKSDSKLEKLCPEGLTESNFSMQQIGVSEEVIDGIDDAYINFEKLYPVNGESNVQPEGLMLTWQEAILADEYRVVIAKNPDMTEVVADFISDYAFCDVSDYVTSGLQTYYWTVEAINKSVNHSRQWMCSDGVSSFTTAKYDALNTMEFEMMIAKAKRLLNAVTSEQYYESAIRACDDAMRAAVEYTYLPEEQITREGSAQILDHLKNTMSDLEKSRIIVEEVWKEKELSMESWSGTESVQATEENGEIVFSAPISGGSIWLNELPKDDVLLTFDMKIDFNPDTNGWVGLEMYRKEPAKNIWSDSGYLIVIKKEQSEVQKYPGGLIDTLMTQQFTDGQFHKINIGVVKEIGSSRFIFRVDDTPFFEYTDFSPFAQNGYFNLRVPQGATVTLRQHQTEEQPESTDLWHDSLYSKKFTAESASCTLTGNWTDIIGSVGSKTASAPTASAVYSFSTGKEDFAVFYRKDSIVNGDPQAAYRLDVDYVNGREGDEKSYSGTLDFSDGAEEWVYLGTYGSVLGGMTLTVTPSGGGAVTTGAVKIVRVTDGYRALTRLMDNDPDVWVFREGGDSLYIGQKNIRLPASVQARNGQLGLPLRALGEALGYSVSWKEAEQTAILTDADGGILTFSMADGSYLEQGRLTVPVGLLAERFGKQLFLGEDDVAVLADGNGDVELPQELGRLFQ